MDVQAARAGALIAAAISYSGERTAATELMQHADELVPYILAPPTVRMVATVTIQDTDFSATTDGGSMTTPATADQTSVTIVIATQDDHGNPTADQLVWTSDDPNALLVTPVISADTKTYTGTFTHTEGTVNITATDPTAPAVAAFTAQVVIGAGATSQLAGTVTVA